jgi:hypothetical protein
MLRFLLPALALLTPLRAQPAAPGVIEGRIVQAATGGALGNVRVSLEGSAREVLTDDAGVHEDGGGDVEEPAETSACQKRRLLILLSQTLGSGSIFFPRP